MELIITNRKGDNYIVHYDLCDEAIIKNHKWHVNAPTNGYAKTRLINNDGKIKHIYMHRMILGLSDVKVKCDHKNRNRLDNRRINLRTCNDSQNVRNKKPSGLSKYLGVTFRPNGRQKKWCARIRSNFKEILLGYYFTEQEAAVAYDNAAKEIHAEFANPNFK